MAEVHDPLAAMIAGLDQALAGLPQIARYLHGVFEAHLMAGFTQPQAFALTRDLHRILMTGGIPEGEN